MRHIFLVLSLFLLVACQGAVEETGSDSAASAAIVAGNGGLEMAAATNTSEEAPASPREPEETEPREAEDYGSAFDGQTRVPRPESTESWTTEPVASDLEHPWAIAFLPDGTMLVTERPGRLRHVTRDGEVSDPIAGVPEVDARNQGGLLDVAVAPDFADSRTVFISYAEPREDGMNTTAVARARMSDDARSLEELDVIFRQYPDVTSTGHYGSRIVFQDPDTIWIGLGDRQGHPNRLQAQDPTNLIGTVARIHTDGSVPEDNPFVGHADNAPELWSWGHRNIQAADIHPETGALWTVEHGPRGGDELNRPEAGKNYGWPTISYGIEYRGGPVYEGQARQDDLEQPVYFWDPVLAPSGMVFYTGQAFPAWQGDAFIGGLRTERVSRLIIEDDRVVAEEWLEIGERVRDVVQGPDGFIYLATDAPNGGILRIVPADG